MADDDIREAVSMTGDRDAQRAANRREYRAFIARSDRLAADRLAREAAVRKAQQIKMKGKGK